MTPEQWIAILGGCLFLVCITRKAGPPPTSRLAPPTVTARVVDPGHAFGDPVALMAQMEQSIDAQGRALAYSNSVKAMIEARSKTVALPWSPPVPPSDVPKA